MNVSRSELEKAANPATKAFNRESYFTKVSFDIHNKTLNITAKIDTGATYTVMGLGNKGLIRYKDKILKSNMRGIAYDASGTELKLYGYIVENFKLTDEIMLDKIKLFFSEDIGGKALLGMDILSLFDFQYLKEKRQNYGTFWINNYDEALKELQIRRLNKDIDYIDPILIANMDNTREIQ
ncbi:MAG: retroviral-like aspartic protease family protein [Lachnospiraceae bacterium]